MNSPCLPLPPPLCASDGHPSDGHPFVEISVRERLIEQVEHVMADFDWSPSQRAKLQQLITSIPNGQLKPPEDGHNDAWPEIGAPFWGMNWLDAPWLFVEMYFYRLILAATDYFQLGQDPFAAQKQASEVLSAEKQLSLTQQLDRNITANNRHALPKYISAAMWGNQFDLGMFPKGDGQPEALEQDRAALTLIDNSAEVVAHISQKSTRRIDIVLDNVGMEFLSDLCLVDFLLSLRFADQIVLHCKNHPLFVSDVTLNDAEQKLQQMQSDARFGHFASRLRNHLDSQRLTLATNPHWTTGLAHWQLSADLRATLAQSDLIISKGDANYRRWLGDLQWDYSSNFAEIVCYAPAPLLCLRTFKSPVA